jgi:alpha-1,3-fucosyltransferase
MFWTAWYGKKIWFNLHKSDMGTSMFHNARCTKHTDCFLTNDHSKIKEADLLLFYYSDAPRWPSVRYSHQYYAHFIHEAPTGRRKFLGQYEGKINVTINFRHDADLYIPYTTILPIESTSTYTPRIPLSKKTKMAVWPVSHCKTSSRREDYVKELSKYITVDKYGNCGKYKCPRTRTLGCLKEWENTYKFYLSFENSMCEDYITEKMFQPLRFELVPVVLGGGNYSADAPPHSVINARDFSSPKDLADFLIKLAADEERYQSYFAWKTHYELVRMQDWLMCR